MRFCVLRGLWRPENMPVGKLECDHDPVLQHRQNGSQPPFAALARHPKKDRFLERC